MVVGGVGLFLALGANLAVADSFTTGGLTLTAPSGGPFYSFFDVFVDINSTGSWFEVPVTPNGDTVQFQLQNYTGVSETLSDAGYFLSPTLIPLDDLNQTLLPPTGSPGSPFIPLPGLDTSSLPADTSEQGDVRTPDAGATGAMLGSVIVLLGLCRRRFQG